MSQENQKISNGANEKHQFIIPAVILVSVVGLMAAYGFIQAQTTGWIRPQAQGNPALYTNGNAQIGDAVNGTGGALQTRGGAILNTGGATNGLIVYGNVGIGMTPTSGYALSVGGSSRFYYSGTERVTISDGLYSNFIGNQQGSVGSPSYTFINDSNTGMYSPSADTIAFTTNGTERMRIDSIGDGSVYIGGHIRINGNVYTNGVIVRSQFFVASFGDNAGQGGYPAAPSCSDYGAPGGTQSAVINVLLGPFSDFPAAPIEKLARDAITRAYNVGVNRSAISQYSMPWHPDYGSRFYMQDSCAIDSGITDYDGTMISFCSWQFDTNEYLQATITVCA